MRSEDNAPKIKKKDVIRGNSILFRNACEDDASFIVNIRNDEKKSRFISATSPDIQVQKQWLKDYQRSENQAYFIITNFDDEPFGTVRLYDQQGDSFCWGSWVLSSDAPSHYAIESALMVYTYALQLGLHNAHFDVRKGNNSVLKFHQRFGAVITQETDLDSFLTIDEEAILASLNKYRKFLPFGIS